MELCPMASMCKGMAEKPGVAPLLMIPGFLLVVGGVLIVIEPRILVWLMAGSLIAIGLATICFAILMRRMKARFTDAGR